MTYTRAEIERIARMAFHLARAAPQEAHQRRQVQRAGDLPALAPGRRRSRGGVPRRRTRTHPGGQLRHAAGPEPDAASTSCDREHVRRHPERRRRGAGRLHRHAALGLHRRPASPPARGSACTSRSTAPPPTSPARTRPTRWAPSAASPPCSNTASASPTKPRPSTRAIEAVLNSGQVTADLKPAGRPPPPNKSATPSAPR